MSSMWGTNLKLSVFGESHGPAVGMVLDGLPAGEKIDLKKLSVFLRRRAPGQSELSSSRRESDQPKIISGLLNGYTTGTPLCVILENKDARSQDYSLFSHIARPGHADYTAQLKYHGFQDVRGSGHFSGRLTAPLTAAGGICAQILAQRNILIGSHISSVGLIRDQSFDPVSPDPALLELLSKKSFPVLNDQIGEEMKACIEQHRLEQDSVGGTVECCILGLPGGIGGPMFGSVESVLSSLLFAIPAVKGVEFGAGFDAALLSGSQNNDSFVLQEQNEKTVVRTAANHHGGILGGITSGMPVLFRTAFKPTPSIGKEQQTVDFIAGEPVSLSVPGRHDPCIVPRAAVCVEAAAALAVLELLLSQNELPDCCDSEERK